MSGREQRFCIDGWSAHDGGSDPKLALPGSPPKLSYFAGVFFEQKASHNRGIRRSQRGNKEFYWFIVGCLGPKPPHMGC